MAPYKGFVGPSYTLTSRVAAAERCLNWYVKFLESTGARGRMMLAPCPGVQTFATLSTAAPGRALYDYEGRVFAVIGARFVEVNADGSTPTVHGTVLVNTNPATITGNGDVAGELFITSGGAAYLFNINTNVFSSVSIPALSSVDMGAYLNGYFMALDTTTSTWAISALANGSSWPVLQAQQRNAATDRWRSLQVANRDVWLHGSKTSEVWQLTGAQPFPFQPIPGANVEWGTAASFSSSVLGSPIWLGASTHGTGMVLHADGYVARRISTHAVEQAIQSYATTADAVSWVYQEDGHTFYVLSFPTAQHTWAYDAATQLWHERAFWNTTTGQEEAWRPQWHVHAFGKHLVLDRLTGVVHDMSTRYGADVDGAAIRRERTAPHIGTSDQRTLFLHTFTLLMENGVGLPTGQGEDPTLMLSVSHDGARTFGPERWESAGRQGEYTPRISWTMLGSGRDEVVRLVVTDPVPWQIVGADLDYTVGVH